MVKSKKEEHIIASRTVRFLRLLLRKEFLAILVIAASLLFFSMKITAFHNPSVLNLHNPVSHLGNVIVMGD